MIATICSIFALVVGFCAGSMRSLETPEVKRLNLLYWNTLTELNATKEELEVTSVELRKVKLELLQAKRLSEKLNV